MSVSENIRQIEECTNSWRLQLEDEKKELQERHKKFSDLLEVFQESLVTGPSMKALDNLAFLPASNSLIHSIFKDEEPGALVIHSDREAKKKQLAEERKAEYNAFLEKKENELFLKRRNFEEKSSVPPKSLLDFVDYEKVLARRKEEETRFRSLNQALYVQPRAQEARKMGVNSVSSVDIMSSSDGMNKNSDNHLPIAQKYQLENNHQTVKLDFAEQLPLTNHNHSATSLPDWKVGETRPLGRMGGGGEPVRDSYGKVITSRSYKVEPSSWGGNSISLPSMERTCSRAKNALYREELQRQIEEKRRLEALEREKAKQLEEKISERSELQRQKMRAEYEEELRRTKNLEAELHRQQERAKQLEEFQRRDAEMRKRKSTEIRPYGDTAYSNNGSLPKRRSPSPPVPAVRTKELMERTVTPIQSLAQVKPENLFSSLAEIRRQILQNQEKKQSKASYEVMNRRTVADVDDDDDVDENIVSYSRVPSVAD